VVAGPEGYQSTGNLLFDQRVKRSIDSIVEVRFLRGLSEWAAADSGSLRTRLGICVDGSRETLVVFEALGSWAFVAAEELFRDGS
jgi:hypothetical protein